MLILMSHGHFLCNQLIHFIWSTKFFRCCHLNIWRTFDHMRWNEKQILSWHNKKDSTEFSRKRRMILSKINFMTRKMDRNNKTIECDWMNEYWIFSTLEISLSTLSSSSSTKKYRNDVNRMEQWWDIEMVWSFLIKTEVYNLASLNKNQTSRRFIVRMYIIIIIIFHSIRSLPISFPPLDKWSWKGW